MGPDAMIFVFWILSFKPTFSLSSFTFIKRLFSFSSLSAIRVVSSACLKLLIFLPAILIPACASSSPAFLMIYSAYKLKRRVTIYSLDRLLSLFGISLFMSSSNCCFLTCIQISQEAGQVVWYYHLLNGRFRIQNINFKIPKNYANSVVLDLKKCMGKAPMTTILNYVGRMIRQ